MTMYALQRRAKDCGITVSSLHPGTVSIVLHVCLSLEIPGMKWQGFKGLHTLYLQGIKNMYHLVKLQHFKLEDYMTYFSSVLCYI